MKMIMQAIDCRDRDYFIEEEDFASYAQELNQALPDKYTFYHDDIELEVKRGVKQFFSHTFWKYPELAPAQLHVNGWNYIDTLGTNAGIIIDLLGTRVRLNYMDSISAALKQGTKLVIPTPGKIQIEFLAPDAKLSVTKQTESYGEGNVRIFGQPRVIQNNLFFFKPPHPGWQMYPLFCYYNGWGDCGTENIFVILNDRQQIVEFIWEASCY